MLDLDKIHFSYEGKKILNNLSFSVAAGEIIALIGLSGSGKTTLFKMIMGLIKPDQGTIQTTEQNLIGYMQQEDLLLPWRNVVDNLLLFAELGKENHKKKYIDKAHSLLRRMGLEGKEKFYPHQLSGGMKQRLTLARALLQERPLLLLDEPFSSLDLLLREELYQLLLEIHSQYNKTLILVTHDFKEALSFASRVLILQNGSIKESIALDPTCKKDPYYCDQVAGHIRKVLQDSLSYERKNEDAQRAVGI